MTTSLKASSHLTGERIDLRWRLERPIPAVADVPRLRLVRRRRWNPAHPDDGYGVAELPEMFATPGAPWARLERFEFRTTNTTTHDGSLEAQVTLFGPTPPPGEPTLARLRFFDATSQSIVEELVTECSRVERTSAPAPSWDSRETLELFRTPGGGPEEPGGVLDIFSGNDDPAIANQLVWTPAGGPPRALNFDSTRHWKIDRTEAGTLTFETRVADVDPGLAWLTIAVQPNLDAGTEVWVVELRDRGLEPQVDYYYALFDLGLASPHVARAVALATRGYDSPRRLFLRLPGAYQRGDEPDPARPTGAPGPLRRFLEPVGHSLDLARSTVEALRDRHDVNGVRVELLPRLAHMIGWSPDLTAPDEVQGRDIRHAPEIFGSVGTVPNVRSLINRATGWPSRVKEFVHNVFLTNAPETIRLWELWVRRSDGTTWTTPERLTLTDGFDGRPAAVIDAGGTPWLFWHSARSGRREIWLQRLDGVDAEPRRAMLGAPDDGVGLTYTDEYPAVVRDGTRIWLFWDSNRAGPWNIWARAFDGLPGGEPLNLTDRRATDRHPAVAAGAAGQLWLFWDSDRRGPTDIWMRVRDTGVWSPPARVTTADLRHEMPAAAVDGTGRLWLFWSEDTGAQRFIASQTFDGGVWSPAERLTDGLQRDEAPAAVWWDGKLWLLWHSDQGGRWHIRARVHDAGVWGASLVLVSDVTANKDPAPLVDAAGGLRVVWRSQHRGARYRSRMLDFADPEMLGEMGSFADRVHYTYDTATGDGDWYARDAVGLYLTPDTPDAGAIANEVDRTRRFVDPFRALPVRYVWPLEQPGFEETVPTDTLIGEEWSDEIS